MEEIRSLTQKNYPLLLPWLESPIKTLVYIYKFKSRIKNRVIMMHWNKINPTILNYLYNKNLFWYTLYFYYYMSWQTQTLWLTKFFSWSLIHPTSLTVSCLEIWILFHDSNIKKKLEVLFQTLYNLFYFYWI